MTSRSLITALVCLLPSRLAASLLCLLGHKVSAQARIGFSLVLVERLYMSDGSRIGHLNLIKCRRVLMRRGAYIGFGNMLRGPFSLWLAETAAVGSRNQVVRAAKPVSYGPSVLRMGVFSKITVGHLVDCMRSVRFGDYSTLAGAASQVWTHGYYHESKGAGRFRVDGRVVIGNNVYIGSLSVISMGVSVADGIAIGSHSSVSKSLTRPGMYVSQPLRFIDSSSEQAMTRLEPVTGHRLAERVYRKPRADVAGDGGAS